MAVQVTHMNFDHKQFRKVRTALDASILPVNHMWTSVRWWAGRVYKRFRAQATFVRSLSGMDANMATKNTIRCKCTTAKRTHKLLDATMWPSHVRSQMTALKERAAANTARKWSFAVMHAAMHLQHTIGHERARAVWAFVRSAKYKALWVS